MIRILFVLFIVVPLLELYVLIEVGSGLGGLLTIGLCLFTAAMGGLIIRLQGMQTLMRARQSMQAMRQQDLAEQGMHGVLLAFAGVLLFIPGFITDTLGFLLLIPSLRRAVIKISAQPHAYQPQGERMPQGRRQDRYQHIIDAEIVDKD